MIHPPQRFTAADCAHAHAAWGCNCGPAALAAMAGLSLDEVRPHLGDFEAKRYMNVTMMRAALARLRIAFGEVNPGEALDYPFYGLCRVQWEGPWMNAGVPVYARYPHTHWIGAYRKPVTSDIVVFDVNCPVGWADLDVWNQLLVPQLVAQHKRASGGWHFTHAFDIPAARDGAGLKPAPTRQLYGALP